MTSESTARTRVQMSMFVRDMTGPNVPMVEVTLPLRAATLARIDEFCKTCKPGEMTRDLALRLMVETGTEFWKAGSEAKRAEEDVPPLRASSMNHLDEASIPEILLHGLILPEDEDPVLGLFQGVRRELSVITALAECVDASTISAVIELDTVLESIGHRLELAIELYARARRARASREPLAPAPRAAVEPLAAPPASPSEETCASSPCPGGQES